LPARKKPNKKKICKFPGHKSFLNLQLKKTKRTTTDLLWMPLPPPPLPVPTTDYLRYLGLSRFPPRPEWE
jgi:hypothetical protein